MRLEDISVLVLNPPPDEFFPVLLEHSLPLRQDVALGVLGSRVRWGGDDVSAVSWDPRVTKD